MVCYKDSLFLGIFNILPELFMESWIPGRSEDNRNHEKELGYAKSFP